MDTSQYMSMFLEESMENLQTLNEALLRTRTKTRKYRQAK